jgi:hypothetical protein
LALAILSVVRVSSDGVAYRKPQVWSNASTLALSQANFPEGRSELPPNAQPDRFAGLVDQYAALVTDDEVIAALKRQGLLKPDAGLTEALPIAATAMPSAVTGAPTPLLKITASAKTPAEATRLTTLTTDTFIKVVEARQIAADIPLRVRIQVDIVTRAGVPELIGPRSKTTPMIVFLAGLTVVVAAAFIRDNMQQREPRHQVEAAPDADPVLDALRNSREAPPPPQDARFGTDHTEHTAEPETQGDVESMPFPRRSSGSSG